MAGLFARFTIPISISRQIGQLYKLMRCLRLVTSCVILVTATLLFIPDINNRSQFSALLEIFWVFLGFCRVVGSSRGLLNLDRDVPSRIKRLAYTSSTVSFRTLVTCGITLSGSENQCLKYKSGSQCMRPALVEE